MMNSKTGSSKFELQDLPPEIAKAAYGLKVDEISTPFTMVNNAGDEVFAIIKLKTSTKAHKANLVDDYIELRKLYQDKKSSEILEEWVKNKQKSIYIHIDEKWRNCEFQYPGWIKKEP